MKAGWRRIGARGGILLLWVVLAVFLLFPFWYAVVTSLQPASRIFDAAWWPSSPTLANYRAVMAEQSFGRNIANSVLVATAVVALSLALGVLAAWALGRVRFAGRRLLLYTILGVSMFPQVAVLAGLFEIVRLFGLYDSLLALVFSNMILTLPFTVWVLTAFMRELPVEVEEAAIMDGATPWTIVTRIFLPLMAPAMVATGLLAFIAAWNEFLFALSFTLSNSQRTVPVAIALITGASQYELPWGNIMAASVIVTVPLVVLVVVFQRRLVAGLTAGAVKG
jgi:trehalose/maltose transport system permease protein